MTEVVLVVVVVNSTTSKVYESEVVGEVSGVDVYVQGDGDGVHVCSISSSGAQVEVKVVVGRSSRSLQSDVSQPLSSESDALTWCRSHLRPRSP